MRITLPSGGWVELRDKLMAADKFAVQDAIRLTLTGNQAGSQVQEIDGGIQNRMRNALLKQVITAWSFDGFPVPSQSASGADIIGQALDLDDYNHLSEQVEPLLEKVSFSPPNQRSAG